nr:hypothetical protein [uncultured Fretibacterium sp.]
MMNVVGAMPLCRKRDPVRDRLLLRRREVGEQQVVPSDGSVRPA